MAKSATSLQLVYIHKKAAFNKYSTKNPLFFHTIGSFWCLTNRVHTFTLLYIQFGSVFADKGK